MTALLEADRVVVTFQTAGRRVEAVRGVSLEVSRGETVGLVGESGSGKSTLARALLGLLRPQAGAVRFDGVDLHRASHHELRTLRRRLQPVFQDSGSALDPRMTIAQSLAEPFELHGLAPRAEWPARVAALLAQVQLPADVAPRLPHELSSGQRQRANLARALALDPELLVLDEPVSALDVSVQAQLLNLLLALRRTRRLALLFISHDLDVVAHLADRLVVLREGQVVETGPTARVIDAPQHAYTRQLLEARKHRLSTAPTS